MITNTRSTESKTFFGFIFSSLFLDFCLGFLIRLSNFSLTEFEIKIRKNGIKNFEN